MPSWEDFKNLIQSVHRQEAFEQLKNSSALIAEINKARLEQNLTQTELAKRAGLKQPAIARIENEGTLPRIDTILKIIDSLDMEIALVPKNTPEYSLVQELSRKIMELDGCINRLNGFLHTMQAIYPHPQFVYPSEGILASNTHQVHEEPAEYIATR